MDENAVITAIASIITDIEVDNEPMFTVYDYLPSQFVSYPSVYVVPVSWQEEYIDLRDTSVVGMFKIGVVYTLEPDMEDAQKQLRDAVALVRTELGQQENIQLDGTVDWSQLTSGVYFFDTKEQRLATCELQLSVRKSYNRFA